MKPLLFFIFLSSAFISAFAQSDASRTDRPFEVGVSVTQMRFYTDRLSGNGNSTAGTLGLATGLYYKRHFGPRAIRVSLDYLRSGFNAWNTEHTNLNYTNSTKTITSSTELRTGYQREFIKTKIRAFVCTDLLLTVLRRKWQTTIYRPGYNSTYFEEDHSTFSGLAIGCGFRADLSYHLSLSFETGATLLNVSDFTAGGFFNLFTLYPVRQLGLAFLF
jgi:hypothetical protein